MSLQVSPFLFVLHPLHGSAVSAKWIPVDTQEWRGLVVEVETFFYDMISVPTSRTIRRNMVLQSQRGNDDVDS